MEIISEISKQRLKDYYKQCNVHNIKFAEEYKAAYGELRNKCSSLEEFNKKMSEKREEILRKYKY